MQTIQTNKYKLSYDENNYQLYIYDVDGESWELIDNNIFYHADGENKIKYQYDYKYKYDCQLFESLSDYDQELLMSKITVNVDDVDYSEFYSALVLKLKSNAIEIIDDVKIVNHQYQIKVWDWYHDSIDLDIIDSSYNIVDDYNLCYDARRDEIIYLVNQYNLTNDMIDKLTAMSMMSIEETRAKIADREYEYNND